VIHSTEGGFPNLFEETAGGSSARVVMLHVLYNVEKFSVGTQEVVQSRVYVEVVVFELLLGAGVGGDRYPLQQ
jgi:hypothetical protein